MNRLLGAHWRLLLSPALSGIENMALDEALLARARRTGESTFRVYTWAEPTLSLGRNQRARDVYDPARATAHGVDIVRRMTGGRALLHHREITYSVSAPARVDESIGVAYQAINAILLHALRALGVDAHEAAASGRMPPPASAPCFELPARGELVVQGRKLVGSAQVQEDGALLQHGSILIDDDQQLIARLTNQPVASPAPAATLRTALGRAPGTNEVAEALFNAVRALADPDARALELEDETRLAADFAARRYASEEWTWRR